MIMCEKCHDKDKDVTKCSMPIDKHRYIGYMSCQICGNIKIVFLCNTYPELKQNNRECTACEYFSNCASYNPKGNDPDTCSFFAPMNLKTFDNRSCIDCVLFIHCKVRKDSFLARCSAYAPKTSSKRSLIK